MEKNFNDAWDSIDLLNTIPSDVYDEINILTGASDKFINEVAKIESMTDNNATATEALNYLKNEHGIESIDMSELRKRLVHPKLASISEWRQYYFLERSIPRRDGDNHTWVERLKTFVDTNTLETVVDHSVIPNHGKLLFTRKSGDHNILHAGRGEYAADFYYWVVAENKPVFVEFKHWGTPDIDAAKTFYADKTYNAKCVIVFTSDHKYYFIDYNKDTIDEITTITVPTDLLIW